MSIFDNMRKYALTDRIAADYHGEQMSYARLNTESDALALWLEQNYQPRQRPLGIYGDKENSTLCAICGANKAGHPYLFLPSFYPVQHLKQLIKNCGVGAVVVCADTPCPFTEEDGVRLLYANRTHPLAETVAAFMGQTPPDGLCVSGDELCALLHTSGSTGIPKLVGVTVRNILSKMETMSIIDGLFDEEKTVGMINIAPLCFAISLQMVYFGLIFSNFMLCSMDMADTRRMVTSPRMVLDPRAVILAGTATLIKRYLMYPEFNEQNCPNLKAIGFGGEPVPRHVVEAVYERFPHITIANVFGATETCISPLITFLPQEMLREHPEYDVMPIGLVERTAGMIRLVNKQGEPVPDGELGEFLFEGDYVAPGYLNDPVQTAEKFYTAADGKRGFRSGDLGYRKDGYYFHVGRINNMYKVGGYRIELEDVENALRQSELIRDAAAVPVIQNGSTVMLAAYVVLTPEGEQMKKLEATVAIKKRVAELRPDYMIPQKIVFVDSLPVNANGKIDRPPLIARERLS